jgi:hypothetical protein
MNKLFLYKKTMEKKLKEDINKNKNVINMIWAWLDQLVPLFCFIFFVYFVLFQGDVLGVLFLFGYFIYSKLNYLETLYGG